MPARAQAQFNSKVSLISALKSARLEGSLGHELEAVLPSMESPLRQRLLHLLFQDECEFESPYSFQYQAHLGEVDALLRLGHRQILFQVQMPLRPDEAQDLRLHPERWRILEAAGLALIQENPGFPIELVLILPAGESYERHVQCLDPVSAARFWDCVLDREKIVEDRQSDWIEARKKAQFHARFPFKEIRPGQRNMIRQIADVLKQKEKLLIEAPTGIGKTLAALYPSFKIQAGLRGDPIFYATAMTSTREQVLRAAQCLRTEGHFHIKTIMLAPKSGLCLSPLQDCQPSRCPYANQFYSRLPEAEDELSAVLDVTPSSLIEIGKRLNLCPYALARQEMRRRDLIIGDSNHAFDPQARLNELFDTKSSVILLVDEAHHLPARTRHALSAGMTTEQIAQLWPYLEDPDPIWQAHPSRLRIKDLLIHLGALMLSAYDFFQTSELEESIRASVEEKSQSQSVQPDILASLLASEDELQELQLQMKESGDPYHSENMRSAYWSSTDFWAHPQFPDLFFKVVNQLQFQIFQVLTELLQFPGRKAFQDFRFELLHLLKAGERFQEGLYLWTARRFSKTIGLYVLALDASDYLRGLPWKGQGQIYFSATLSPLPYYADLLGLSGEVDVNVDSLPSPFPPERRLCLSIKDFDLSYKGRSRDLSAILDAIFQMTSLRKGNYMVFCPSFSYLSEIRSLLKTRPRPEQTDLMLQVPQMSERQKRLFLNRFEDYGRKTLISFAVLGSLFSEGIDLRGERLSGVIVLGAGLPALSPERQALAQFYDQKMGNAFLYAYLYPGFNRVQQAVGRLIRSEADEGIVILMDRRWQRDPYQTLIPESWNCQARTFAEALDDLAAFWEARGHDNKDGHPQGSGA